MRDSAGRKAWDHPGVRLGLGLAASLLFLYLAFKDVSLQEVGESLRQANLAWVGAALLSVLLNNLFKVIRWQVMLGPAGRKVSFVDLLMSHLSGQMLNAVVPLRVGDVSRSLQIGARGPGWAFVLGSVALEKIIDLVCFALLFLSMLLLIPLPGWVGNSAWGFVGVALLVTLATYLAATQRGVVLRLSERATRWLPANWQAYLLGRLHNGLDSLEVLQRRSDLVRIALWSGLAWFMALATNQLTLLALDIHLDWSASLVLLVALIAGINVVTVPGRIGVFEWVCVLVLSLYGVDQAEALSYGLLLHALVYLPVVLGGVLSFVILSRSHAAVQTYGNG